MADNRIQETVFGEDLTKAQLWEYNQAEILQSLIAQKNAWYATNQTQFWSDWVSDVFDIRTCGQFGLVVWSIILNIPLNVNVVPTSGPAFGFGVLNQNFNNGNFQISEAATVDLTIEQQRSLLLLRYNQLTGNCTVPFINRMLKNILGEYGSIYVLDPLDMSRIIYVVDFLPSPELWFILYQADVLPRPAGVKIEFIIRGFEVFGFGSFNQNFNNGNFINPIIM